MAYYQSYSPLGAADICVPVTLEYEQSEFKPNNAWIFGAFLLGLLFGAGVTLLLVPCTLRSLAKKKVIIVCLKNNVLIQKQNKHIHVDLL